jgi:hypothetical protein
MCNTKNGSKISDKAINAIKKAVEDLGSSNQMFTNWDAITCARKESKAFLGEYKDLKSIVWDLFQNNKTMYNYSVKTVPIQSRDGKMINARVYYPVFGIDKVIDPETDYNPRAIHPNQIPPTSISATNDTKMSTELDDDSVRIITDQKNCSLTKECRLNISPKFIVKMNLHQGEKIQAFHGVDRHDYTHYIAIHFDNIDTANHEQIIATSLQVNKDNRLRIPGSVLSKVFADVGVINCLFDVQLVEDISNDDNSNRYQYIRIMYS